MDALSWPDAPTCPLRRNYDQPVPDQKLLSALLLVAIIAVVSAFLLTARGDPPVEATDRSNVSGPAELNDLQFMADQEGITLDEAIEMYAWRDDFSRLVTAIQEEHPDSVTEAASTSGSTALIKFSGSIPADAQRTIEDFETQNPNLTIVTQTNVGYTEEEYVKAVVGAYYSVMAEDAVKDGRAHFEGETNEIVILLKMKTPPSDAKKAQLERSAEQGAKDATRQDILDTFSISLSVVQRDISGLDSGSEHMGGETLGSCSSGFNVKVNGIRGITTAAHCPDNLWDDGDTLTFRDKHHGVYGDVQWHTGPDIMGHSFYAGSISVHETNRRDVTSVGTAQVGDRLCRNGRISYQDCQEVRRINICAVWVCRLVSMQNYYAADGDSGSPVFMNQEAFGVHRGKTWWFGWREIFSQAIYFDDAISGMSVATD